MKQEERTRRKESGGRVGLVGKVGALTERGMEKEFELRRIRLAVAVVVRWTGGLAGIEGGEDRRQERVRVGADSRAESTVEKEIGWRTGSELSQQLSAQLAGFISIGTICRAK